MPPPAFFHLSEGILLLLILFYSNKNYAFGGIYTIYPYEDTECFNNSSNYDFWDLLTFEEDSSSQADTNSNNLYNSEMGAAINSFEGDTLQNLKSEVPNDKHTDKELTNCIPNGPVLFLLIGLLCFCLARLIKEFLFKNPKIKH